jgi:hypothetical protein
VYHLLSTKYLKLPTYITRSSLRCLYLHKLTNLASWTILIGFCTKNSVRKAIPHPPPTYEHKGFKKTQRQTLSFCSTLFISQETTITQIHTIRLILRWLTLTAKFFSLLIFLSYLILFHVTFLCLIRYFGLYPRSLYYSLSFYYSVFPECLSILYKHFKPLFVILFVHRCKTDDG